jgi:hypothetical protein
MLDKGMMVGARMARVGTSHLYAAKQKWQKGHPSVFNIMLMVPFALCEHTRIHVYS